MAIPLQKLYGQVNATIGQLASLTSILLGSQYDTELEESFFLRKMKLSGIIQNLAAGEGITIGLCRGDATVAELDAELETSSPHKGPDLEPKDRKILDTISIVAENPVVNWEPKLPPKGYPLQRETGFQLFAYNQTGAAMTNATLVLRSLITMWGVWLD